MLTEIVSLVLCVLVVFLWAISSRNNSKFPPGPSWRPFIGHGPSLRKLAAQLGGQHFAFMAMARQYQTDVLGLQLGRERVVCVCSYSTIKQVLTCEEYHGRPDNFFMRLRTMGTRKGITGADGELWREQRAFLMSHFRALGYGKCTMEEMVHEEIKELLDTIRVNSIVVDVSAMLAPMVLSILWKLTSGSTVKGDAKIVTLLQLLKKRTAAFDMSGGTLNNYPWLRFVAPEKTGYNVMQSVNSQIGAFILETIREHQKTWTEGREDDLIYTFLGEMRLRQNQNSNFTEEQLVMLCLDIFIAGSATTSNTLDFAFLAMIIHPEVQEKVFNCLNEAFDENQEIRYSDRTRVPYIEAVLLECQRYYPVVPVIGPRRALKTTSLAEYIIPRDTTVLINLHAVYQDVDYWENPDQFNPDRFLDAGGHLMHQERVLTFGLGKRRCLGDALAKVCLFLCFVEVLRRFRIENGCEGMVPSGKQVPGILMTTEQYVAKFVPRY